MIIPELANRPSNVIKEPPENISPEVSREQTENSNQELNSEDYEEGVFPLDLDDPDIIDYDIQKEQIPLYIVTRDEWKAEEPKGAKELLHPLPDVLFTYTNSDTCDGWEECANFMKKQQKQNMEVDGMPDIQYNFYIAKDWTVYEGCGWDTEASNIQYYPRPDKMLTVCYIGRYEGEIYPSIQVRSVMDSLLELAVERGYLKEDFANLPVLI